MASGQLVGFTSFRPPSASIGDDAVSVNDPLGVTKVRHIRRVGSAFALAIGGTPSAYEQIVYVALTSGTVRNVGALCNDTGSSASITFDLKKNGSSILTGAIAVTNATTDKATVAGSISSASYAAGDVFSMQLSTSSTTGMTGPYMFAEFDELTT